MEPGSVEARLLALESSELGFAKMLENLVDCVGALTTYVKNPNSADASILQTVLDGLMELSQSLARLSEFLGPKDG